MSTLTAKFVQRLFELFKIYLTFSLTAVALAIAYESFTGPLPIMSESFLYYWMAIVCIAVIIALLWKVQLRKAKY